MRSYVVQGATPQRARMTAGRGFVVTVEPRDMYGNLVPVEPANVLVQASGPQGQSQFKVQPPTPAAFPLCPRRNRLHRTCTATWCLSRRPVRWSRPRDRKGSHSKERPCPTVFRPP